MTTTAHSTDTESIPDLDNPRTRARAIAVALSELKAALRERAASPPLVFVLQHELERISNAIKESVASLVETMSNEARLESHLGVMEAQERLRIVAPFVERAMARAGTAIRAEVADFPSEPVKLQLALGRMEAADIIDERRMRAREQLGRVRSATTQLLDDVVARLARLRASAR